MAVANTLAYYVTATLTAVESFIAQVPGGGGNTKMLCSLLVSLLGEMSIDKMSLTKRMCVFCLKAKCHLI
jgi:hypothetical protein